MSEEIKKIDYPEQPDRCQSSNGRGQCDNVALPGVKYCKAHNSGNSNAQNKKAARLYQLQVYQNRLSELADHEGHKTLSEEIAIARMTLEGVMQLCTGPADLVQYSTKISDLVSRIQKLVQACASLEKASGNYLDKSTIIQIGGQMIEIVTRYVDDPEVLGLIADELMNVIKEARNDKPAKSTN